RRCRPPPLLVRLRRHARRRHRPGARDRRAACRRRRDQPLLPAHPSAAVHARALRIRGGTLPDRRGCRRAHPRPAVLSTARGRGSGAGDRGVEQRRRDVSEAEAKLAELIGALEAELVSLRRAANEAEWQLNVTGEDRWEEESTRSSSSCACATTQPAASGIATTTR